MKLSCEGEDTKEVRHEDTAYNREESTNEEENSRKSTRPYNNAFRIDPAIILNTALGGDLIHSIMFPLSYRWLINLAPPMMVALN